jgi:hypothetical protein
MPGMPIMPRPGRMPMPMPMPGSFPAPGVVPGLGPRTAPRTGPIPGVRPSAAPAPAQAFPAMPPGAEYGEEGEGEEGAPMEGLEAIRARLMADPNALQQLLTGLQATNPDAYQMIQQNPQAFLQLLAGGGMPRPRGGIQVTPEEKAAIDRVFKVKLICS